MPWSAGTFSRANGATGWQDDQAANIGIEAGRHDTQDNDFRNGINETINKAGQNTPTANLPMGGYKHTGVANASANDQYAAYGQTLTLLGQYMPPGAIVQYAADSASAPTGWLYCRGQTVVRATYQALFDVIGTTFNTGGESGTDFRLPNLQQRFPLGKATSGTGSTFGTSGGAIDHTHSVPAHYHGLGTGATLATTTSGAHRHTIPNRSGNANVGSAAVTAVLRGGDTTQGGSTGNTLAGDDEGSHAHSMTGTIGLVTGGVDGNAAMTSGTNNPPYLVVNYIIRT